MTPNLGFYPVTTGERYFISYRRDDSRRIGGIARHLSDMGVPMWYDYGIPMAEDFEKIISENISNCKAMILFATKEVFLKDSFMRFEYETASKLKKKIYVISLDSFSIDEVEPSLSIWYTRVMSEQALITSDKTWSDDKIANTMIEKFPLLRRYTSRSSSSDVGVAMFFLFVIFIGVLIAASYSEFDLNKDASEEAFIDGDRINSYIFVPSDNGWEDAWNACLERGGHLAWINSELEFNYVAKYLSTYSVQTNSMIDFVYLGGIKGGENEYHWKNTDEEIFPENIAESSSWYVTHWYSGEMSDEGKLVGAEDVSHSQDVVSLAHVETDWFFMDTSTGLTANYPDALNGKVGYLIEYEGGMVIPQSAQGESEQTLIEEVVLFNGITVPAAEFIFPYSSSRVITKEELYNLSHDKDERLTLSQIAINEILARYGYYPTAESVSAQTIRNKYDDREWYEKVRDQCPSKMQDILIKSYLNPVECDNIKTINEWQEKNS